MLLVYNPIPYNLPWTHKHNMLGSHTEVINNITGRFLKHLGLKSLQLTVGDL